MKTITVRIGTKMKVLVDFPLSADLRCGEIVEVVRFTDGIPTPVVRGGRHRLIWWLDAIKWPHHYEVVK